MTQNDLKQLIQEVIKEVIQEAYEDKIKDAKERMAYLALRKQEKDYISKSKQSSSPIKKQHYMDMSKQVLDKALDILRKHGIVDEANTKELQKLGFEPVKEGRMKDIAMDLEDLSDDEFTQKYGQSKAEIQALLGAPEPDSLDESFGVCAMKLTENISVSKPLAYHLTKNLSLTENVFRTYSDAYFDLLNEVRDLYFANKIELCDVDAELVESDLGKKALFNGRTVYLDAPIEEAENLVMELKHRGKNVHLSRPFRTPGGPKKYAVYVKSKGGNVKKVTFGDPNMRSRASSKARRKSFAARHKCSQKKDRTTAGYWSCRSHRIKSLGNKGHGKYW
jgi:hypothetical protein